MTESLSATLANLSPLPRQHWGIVTFPESLAAKHFGIEARFVLSDGREFRAVRGRTVGCKTVFRIRAYLSGHEIVEGKLVPLAATEAPEAFKPHPWVSDNLEDLIPDFGLIDTPGDPPEWADDPELELIAQSPAHQRWHVRRRLPADGLHLHYWTDILHDDPVMPIWGKLVWSHRSDPNHNRSFGSLLFRSGEFVAFDFDKRHGMGQPFQHEGKWVRPLHLSPLALNDGAGLPLSGAMLAYRSVEAGDEIPDPEDHAHPDVAAMRDLTAGAHGPIVGVCHQWGGRLVANKHVPRLATEAVPAHREAMAMWWDAFDASMDSPAGWFAARPVAIGKTPGQTGLQEDFGAQKGTYAVTLHDPRFLRIMQYSVQSELFRGFNHYEDTGEPIDLEDHPKWVTWNGVTHWHTGVSPDRLGKSPIAPPPATGWLGYDDQHRSQNNLATYLALTDDPLMEDQVLHHSTVDLAAYRVKYPQNGTGAARAQGRCNGALAQLMAVVEGRAFDQMTEALRVRTEAIRNNPNLQVSGPMKVLGWGNPDNRKQVYYPDGSLARWCSMWEHGLAIVGLYQVYKRNGPGYLKAKWVLDRICPMLAEFGCFLGRPHPREELPDEDVWHTVDDLAWYDGAAPHDISATSREVLARPGTRGTANWTFAGLLVAKEYLRKTLGPDHAHAKKLEDYVAAITGGKEAADRLAAEWWAAVESV